MGIKVYDQAKENELTEYDLSAGKLVQDKRFVAHHESVPAVEAKSAEEIAAQMRAEGKKVLTKYMEVTKEYPNGGTDVKTIKDIDAVPEQAAWDEYEDIYIYKPYTAEELVEQQRETLRARRAAECFPIVNRGALWYDKLTAEQKSELSVWYEKWLDAPQTLYAPVAPSWISVGKKTE